MHGTTTGMRKLAGTMSAVGCMALVFAPGAQADSSGATPPPPAAVCDHLITFAQTPGATNAQPTSAAGQCVAPPST